MKQSLDVSSIVQPISAFFHRFHSILFFLLLSGGLIASILILLSIITLSSSTAAPTTTPLSNGFDQAAIDQVKNMDIKSPSVPGSRENPFVE